MPPDFDFGAFNRRLYPPSKGKRCKFSYYDYCTCKHYKGDAILWCLRGRDGHGIAIERTQFRLFGCIQAVFQKFQHAYNARDLDTIAALHTQNAIELRSWEGLATGDTITKGLRRILPEAQARWSTKLSRSIPSVTLFAR